MLSDRPNNLRYKRIDVCTKYQTGIATCLTHRDLLTHKIPSKKIYLVRAGGHWSTSRNTKAIQIH